VAKVHIAPAARDDLAEIKRYISEELSSPQAAKNTVSKIIKGIKNLGRFPNSGPSLSSKLGFETSYRFIVSGNFLSFYRVEGDGVFVDRVIYGRRDYTKILFPELPLENSETP
jgi:plasmid stabilization system protein ParE